MYSQKNIEKLFEIIGKIPGQTLNRTDYYDCIKTTDSIWPNQLFNLKAPITDLDKVLEQIENSIEKGRIPGLLMCNPSNDNQLINEKLMSRKYKKGSWTAMTHDLDLENINNANNIEQLKIRRIKTPNRLDLWIEIVEKELMNNSRLNKQIFNELLKLHNCYFYIGFLGNIPVATSFLFIDGSSAGIYLVSTIGSHRKKGFGSLMTYKCLKKAKETNCNYVAIQATDSGKSMYQSLGFKEYGIINVFRIKKVQ